MNAIGNIHLPRPGFAERTAAVVVFFVYSFSLPTDWFREPTSNVEGGGLATQLVFLLLFASAILGLNGNWRVALTALGREPLLPALIALAIVSAIWSTSAALTAQAGVVLAISLVIALQLLVRFELVEILTLAALALAIGVVINYVFIFVFQEAGLDEVNVSADGQARWSGVFSTKNELGRIASLSAMVFVLVARIRRRYFAMGVMTLLALIQVFGSDSATSLGAAGGIAVLTVVFVGFRARKTLYGATAVAMVTVFSLLVLLAATNLAVATGLLGKDSSFTGRLPLWVNSFRYGISRRPWTGYGWTGFWGNDLVEFDVLLRSGFDSPHAHNAFIDAWLFVGPVGAAVLLALYLRGLVWGARNIRADGTAAGLFPILMISYSFIFSLTEAGVVRRDISFILFIIAIVTAARNKGKRQPFVAPPDPERERPTVLVSAR